MNMKKIHKIKDLHIKAENIAANPATPRPRAEYARAYANTIAAIIATIVSRGEPKTPTWTEGKHGNERYMGIMDAIDDAEKIGIPILFVHYGSISASYGAHNASDPQRWTGYPENILRGDTPWKESRRDGYRPTECDIAAQTALWCAENPKLRTNARPAIRGHYGQCAYCTLWIAP